ncbi:MAG: PilZ domain [Pseudomonadota bacterium]|jgi:PilZ domain
MQIAARLAVHAAAPDRRRKDRIPTTIPTLLSTDGYFGMPVTVLDVSTHGFRLVVGAHIPPSSLVRLKLPGLGIVVGRVVWSKKGEVGGGFINPMSEQRLNMIPGVKKPKLASV